MSRRAVVAGTASGLALAGVNLGVLAQDAATPLAGASQPGVALARVRKLPTAELNQAIYPDVMRTFLPVTAVIPGFYGYLIAFDAADPTGSLTLTIVNDDTTAEAATGVARWYVEQLDPRFVVETPIATRGPIRVFEVTDRSASELPPFLNGCFFTMRNRTSAPGVTADQLVPLAAELAGQLKTMPGFVLYCWIETEGGRTNINIWETAEQLQTGDEAVAAYVAANSSDTSVGEAIVNDGPIGYAEIAGLTV
jgi:hypothetical protein